ncbi:hypothetical protein NU195Hw_g8996t1 [Hortaea werneckii]
MKFAVTCTHLGLYDPRKRRVTDFHKRRDDQGLAQLVFELRKCGGLNPADRDVNPFHSDTELVKQYFWGAPKLRQALRDIFSHLQKNRTRNRVMVLFNHSDSAHSFHKVLSFMGFKVLILGSDMNWETRHKVIRDFNSAATDYQVILIPMSLDLLGFSMQDQCNKVIVVEQAANKATEDNATMRVRRHGQLREQTVTRHMMSMTATLNREMAMQRKLTNIARVQFDLIPEGMPYELQEELLRDATSSLLGKLRENIPPSSGPRQHHGSL